MKYLMLAYKSRRRYSKEFKQESVQLILSVTHIIGDVANDLEIHRNTVTRWVREYKVHANDAFPGNGKLMPADEEIRQLRRELACVKEERDILKKAVAFFSRDEK